MGERQLRGGGRAERRGDPGHHGAGDAVRRQHLDLFPAASEDERVAALQARHALALAGEAQQQLVDALLRILAPGLLADEDALRVASRTLEHRLAHQPVVENHVGTLQLLQRAPMKRASAPRRSGSSASICSRTRRASTGACPAELTATTSGERSTIAGKMKVESSASSTTLTGTPRSRALAATRAFVARS